MPWNIHCASQGDLEKLENSLVFYFIEIHISKSSSYERINKRVRELLESPVWKALIAAHLKPSGVYWTQNLRPIDFSALISQLGSLKKTTRAAAQKKLYLKNEALGPLGAYVCVQYAVSDLPNTELSV